MSVSQVWLSSLLSHLLKCMIEGASVEAISKIVQMFSLLSISKENMGRSFRYEAGFWQFWVWVLAWKKFLKIIWTTTNPQILRLGTVMKTLWLQVFIQDAEFGGFLGFFLFFFFSLRYFGGLLLFCSGFVFNGEISLLPKRSQEKQWKMSYLNDSVHVYTFHTLVHIW